jgi:hypothetical protein
MPSGSGFRFRRLCNAQGYGEGMFEPVCIQGLPVISVSVLRTVEPPQSPCFVTDLCTFLRVASLISLKLSIMFLSRMDRVSRPSLLLQFTCSQCPFAVSARCNVSNSQNYCSADRSGRAF